MFRKKYIDKRKTAWSGGIAKHIAAIILCLTMLSYGTQAWGYEAGPGADDGTLLGNSTLNTAVGVDSTATGTASTAIGAISSATGEGSTATGNSSKAPGWYSAAYGWNSNAAALYSTAVGNSSYASAENSTAIGSTSQATHNYTTAIGADSIASGNKSNAIGASSRAIGTSSIAIGNTSTAGLAGGTNIDGSIAIGEYSAATGAYSVSIGWTSIGQAEHSTAIGVMATSTGLNSVAIGANSNDNSQADVVSVGSSTGAYVFTRRITNVTAGTADTDAANVGQLNALIDVNNTSGAADPSATGNNSIAIGGGSVASEENVVSVGNATTQRRITNVAAGTAGTDAVNKDQLDAAIASVTSDTSSLEEAKAYTDDKIAVNNTSGALDPSATGADSVAVGSGAVASAANTVAVGSNAQATGTNAIAIGRGATATGSVAVGTGASASNGGSAFGDNTTSSGTNSAAIGYGATSTGSNSVVIGSNSTDGGESNVVSVGNTTTQRRITNVDAGVNDTDAVNVSQLNAVSTNIVSGANAYTDRKINDLSDEAHRGIAGAIAMSRAIMSLNPGESGISAGFGESGGQGAVAMSFQHSTKDNIQFNIGASFDTQNVQVGGGIGIKF